MGFFSRFWHHTLHRPYHLHKSIDQGEGPYVLLIHGLGTDGSTWEPLLRIGNDKPLHYIGYDLLGFGKSPKPEDSTYSVEEHARSLLASLSLTQKRKGLIVIGHSMGCLVASHIAYHHPSLVSELILYEPPLFADSPEFRSHKRRKELYFSFYEQLLLRPQILMTYSKLVGRFAQNRVINMLPEYWVPFQRSLKNTIMKQTAYSELKKITVPTQIIYGKFDFVVTRTDVKKMLSSNSHITFHLVNEMHDVTDRAAHYILKLLDQLY